MTNHLAATGRLAFILNLHALLYRRRFVVELLMALHDSPLASKSIRRTALLTISSATCVSAYATDLIARSGWLNAQSEAPSNIMHLDFVAILHSLLDSV